jgi:hypothetical protein
MHSKQFTSLGAMCQRWITNKLQKKYVQYTPLPADAYAENSAKLRQTHERIRET